MSTFHEDFTLQLRADLALALGLPSAAVYVGLDPQRVARPGLEVWIRPAGVEPAPGLRLHRYEVHARLRSRREGDQTGAAQSSAVLRALATLSARYEGARPFVRAVPTLVAIEVGEHGLEEAGDDVLDGRLLLRVGERP